VRDRGPWTVRDRGPSGFGPDRLQYSSGMLKNLTLFMKYNYDP
jgi:hypothetical protein